MLAVASGPVKVIVDVVEVIVAVLEAGVFFPVAVAIHQATGLDRHGLDILVFLLPRRDALGPHRRAVGERIKLADGFARLAHGVFVGGGLQKPRQRGSLEIIGRQPLAFLGIVGVEHAGLEVRQVFQGSQVAPEDVDDRFEIVISQFSEMDILEMSRASIWADWVFCRLTRFSVLYP